MGGKIIESPWVETNNALKQKFDGFAAEHKTKSAPIPDLLLFQDDYLIKQWILSLNSLTQRLEALISQVNTSWQQDSAEEEKIHGMLLEALPELSELIDKKKKLEATIWDRKHFLLPSETPITQAFLTETRNELRDTLISFLTIFSMVHFENADDQFNALLINKLKEFLEEIVKDLRTLNPLAHMKILEFQGKLLRHLDLIAPLFSAGTRNELDPNQIDAFVKTVLSTTTKPVTRDSRPKIINGLLNIASTNLNRLLDHPSEERVEAYGIKRQLISLRSLKFKLDHFPINTIKEYLIQTKKIKERIADITLTLQTLKKELKSTLDLFIEPFNDYEDVRKGRLFLAELEKIEGEFEAVLAQYKDQAIPTLEQLGQITSVQRDIVIKLEGLHQKLKGEKNLYKETLDLTSHLASQYHLSLINLRYNLRQSFQNTRVVLSAYLRLPAEMKNEGVLERAQATLILLDTMRQELCAETRENRPLATIHRENQLAIQDFEQHSQIPREILAIAYKKILADLMQRAALPLPTLEQRNSIANGLISQKEAALSAIEAAKSAYTTLTTSNQQCVASLSAFAQADSALVAFEKSVQQASIEDRKRSKHYLKSLEIIKVIQEEYFRILKKYFDQACENNPDEIANFVKLKEKRWTRNAFHAHADRFTDLLDKIDPRLCRLLSLQFGYERLNEKYLNGNFLKSAQIKCNEKALASTEQRVLQAEQHLYKNQLIKTVEDTLHNESMEYISEGIRSDFVQWIRIHVLKPLQYLLTYCFVPNFFFTPTWRACRTEEFLVEAGNQFYNELTDNPGF